MFVSVRQMLDGFQTKLESLAVNRAEDRVRFESHMEECSRRAIVEAELARVRHEENTKRLDKQDDVMQSLSADSARRQELILAEMRGTSRWMLTGAFATALAMLGILVAIITHLVKLAP